MVPAQNATMLRQLNRLLVTQSVQEQTDAQLLRRFAARREEAAFAALLARHGRLVWDVCRHTLGHEQDAEDAFQATFLVLARKAGSVRKGESVGSFLYGVAYRIAMKAKHSAATRRAREQRAAGGVERPGPDAGLRELQTILTEEVNRLPPRHRAVFVLCCLEGMSKREAAEELCLKEGTVASRLARARQRLQDRLTRRGVILAAALTTAAVAEGTAAAALPAALVQATLQAAPAFASGKSAGVLSAPVAALTEGVLRAMFVTKLKVTGFLLATLAIVAAGTGVLGQQALAPQPAAPHPDGPAAVVQKVKPEPARAGAAEAVAAGDKADEPVVLVDKAGERAAESSDAEKLQGVWLKLDIEEDAHGQPVKGTNELRSVIDGDKITLTLRLLNPTAYHDDRPGGIDRREWETIVGTFTLEPDKKRMLIKGTWKNALLPKPPDDPDKKYWGPLASNPPIEPPAGKTVGDFKDTTIVATYQLHDDLLVLELPPPRKEPTDDRLDTKKAPRRMAIFVRDKAGDKAPADPAPPDKATAWKVSDTFRGKNKTLIKWMAFSPDGKQFIAQDDYGLVLREVGTKKQIAATNTAETHAWFAFAGFTADNVPVGLRLEGKTFGGNPPKIELYDIASGKALTTFKDLWTQGPMAPFALSPGGDVLATAEGRRVVLWDTKTGEEINSLLGRHRGSITALVFSPDGKMLATSATAPDATGDVKLWDLAQRKEVARFSGIRNSRPLFSPDGKTLAVDVEVADDPHRPLGLKLFDTATGKELIFLKQSNKNVRPDAFAFTPDGKSILVSWPAPMSFGDADPALIYYDVTTGKEVGQIMPASERTTALAFSPDGKMLATGDSADTVRWWVPVK